MIVDILNKFMKNNNEHLTNRTLKMKKIKTI